MPDIQLLHAYLDGDEAAFREIVSRHTDLVYSAALRQVNSPDLAKDIAQNVFLDLVRKAREVGERLAPNASLAGWLYRSTGFAVLNRLRDDSRRAKHERQAMEQLLTDGSPEPDWDRIRPVLDEAMAELSDTDRDAIVLRYFKNHDFHFVGQSLGLSDDAAQKRVSRAVERLREYFSKRGIAIGVSGLVVVISANAVHAAPLAITATISTAAVLAGTTIPSSTATVATKAIAMTTTQKLLVTATVAIFAGAGIYEARQARHSREQIKAFQQQQESLNEQIRQLQHERDDANVENEKLQNNIAALNNRRVEQPAQASISQAKSQSPDVPTPDKTETKSIHLSKDTWTDAGFATTEAALKTRGWAVLNGNRERFSQSLSITPQARKLMEDMLIQMAKASNDPDREQFLQAIVDNKLGVEEAILMPMMALNQEKGFTSYNILSQQTVSPDESILEVQTEMTSALPQSETMKFQRFGSDWKIVIDEDFVKSKH